MAKTKRLRFQISEAREVRIVEEVAGQNVAVMSRIYTVVPAKVSEDDLTTYVNQHAKYEAENEEWSVELPGLDETVSWCEPGEDGRIQLMAEVASSLNGYGVSVEGFGCYDLDR